MAKPAKLKPSRRDSLKLAAGAAGVVGALVSMVENKSGADLARVHVAGLTASVVKG